MKYSEAICKIGPISIEAIRHLENTHFGRDAPKLLRGFIRSGRLSVVRQGSSRSTKVVAFRKRLAGRTCAGTESTPKSICETFCPASQNILSTASKTYSIGILLNDVPPLDENDTSEKIRSERLLLGNMQERTLTSHVNGDNDLYEAYRELYVH
jgi:hypothetical protein